MKRNTIERLSIIKYLFNRASEFSIQPEPQNGLSVLLFHDSIELCLNLICETRGINVPRNFMEYWSEINKSIGPQLLSHQTAMNKLNKARVNLKHHGIIPSKIDIEAFRIMVLDFFEENYPAFFNIDFKNVSLIDLLKNEKAKIKLKEAEESFTKNLVEECIKSLATSFGYLINDYESNKIDKSYQSPFEFSDRFRSFSNIPENIDRDTKRYLRNISESINAIHKVLKLITIGIDYKNYIRFSAYVPGYLTTANDEIIPFHIDRKTLSIEEFEFCRNFIIDTALRLQSTDFKLDENDYYG